MGRQGVKGMGSSLPTEQFEARVPVIVPVSFFFKCVYRFVTRLPSAVVMHGGLKGAAITACYIPNDAINVEKQDCLWL
jgi:hypothetical protein